MAAKEETKLRTCTCSVEDLCLDLMHSSKVERQRSSYKCEVLGSTSDC